MYKRILLFVVLLILILAVVSGCFSKLSLFQKDYQEINGVKIVSKVEGEDILVYSDQNWEKKFWYGINLGATIPGHYPGELSPKYEDYCRWFADMEELGIDCLRVYTILPPHFYQALLDHNRASAKTLWLVQGVWPPDEILINEQDAYLPEITEQFKQEISQVLVAVYGKGKISPRFGKASGIYTANVAPYLLAWLTGSEWHPLMVEQTNKKNPEKQQFDGHYFTTFTQSSPFETWLASLLDYLAGEEVKNGWQHPISFVNWVTTDPLAHPNEPIENEDLVSVDPMHILSTKEWRAGYFASYHVYPYYPDSLRYQEEYQNYINKNGQNDPYEAYLLQLKEHHNGIPLVVAEFGVPSSRGMAHRGPMGRDQGMHTEQEQGKMEIEMFQAIKNVGIVGGFLFAWQDEWFKFTWNTWDWEIPAKRRASWLNRLTNEENFGLIAVEPGNWTKVKLDGVLNDWDELGQSKKSIPAEDFNIMVSSDEAYLYLALNKNRNWEREKENIIIGFDTLPGGNSYCQDPAVEFKLGIEFLLDIDDKKAVLKVASAYDQHTYLYGSILKLISWKDIWQEENNGIFLPWKLCLSNELYLPLTKKEIPFEEIELGILIFGNSNPDSKNYNSLADYYIKDNNIEIRIPWMMLGFTDPGKQQVCSYPYKENLKYVTNETSPGINFDILIIDEIDKKQTRIPSFTYEWQAWDKPSYHERKKQSYYLLQDYIKESTM